jgi:DNA-binding transcriptional regulator of glucitol operon
MNSMILVFGAIVIGMCLQVITTYQQTRAFGAAVRELKTHGEVSIGGGGKRYRGGKAFVAIAAGANGKITKAISLSGWTTFARPRELSNVRGLSLARLRGSQPLPSVAPQMRSALQNAAQTLDKHLAKTAA